MSGSADAVLTVGSTAGPAPGGNVTWDGTAGMYDTTWVNNDHSHQHWAPPAPAPGDNRHQHVLEPQPQPWTAPSFNEMLQRMAEEIRRKNRLGFEKLMEEALAPEPPKAVPPPAAKRQDKVRRIRG